MNLGHGRAGHLPDYSFARYRYMPAWANYEEILKDNPSDYWHAFCQMVYAMRCLREGKPFEVAHYDFTAASSWEQDIRSIFTKRQLDSSDDWRALGERMVGTALEPFDLQKYQQEYLSATEREKDGPSWASSSSRHSLRRAWSPIASSKRGVSWPAFRSTMRKRGLAASRTTSVS